MSCVLKAIADAPRRTILRSLLDGALPAEVLGQRANLPQPALAEHLRVLRRAGLLSERRGQDGTRYRLERERFRQLASQLRAVVAAD
jgi:DNA-binding transcriptional ArsR family regulator